MSDPTDMPDAGRSRPRRPRTPSAAGTPPPGDVIQRSRLARDVLDQLQAGARKSALIPVIIEFNNDFPGGAREARARLVGDYIMPRAPQTADYAAGPERQLLIESITAATEHPIEELKFCDEDKLFIRRSAYTESYLFGELTRGTLETIARLSSTENKKALIYKVWLDQECGAFISSSYRTVKCDAGQAAFGARGDGVLWAVADTGIQGDHPHFQRHKTLQGFPAGVDHRDFTTEDVSPDVSSRQALQDADGHGTHVAGIIAGETRVEDDAAVRVTRIVAQTKRRIDENTTEVVHQHPKQIAGLAPLTKLLSLKVLASRKSGRTSMLLAAIGYVQVLNEYGRNVRVHGLNLSLGYTFEPLWFAAGQSPLCKEVDRLVKSGVVVVVAAGNGGYGVVTTQTGQSEKAAHASTIADPGNAELAITVGSTHRERPHEFGVSYFSAKGPTADGRNKPDLVAPGERIISCALTPENGEPDTAYFCEETGTSMAAPHVSSPLSCRFATNSKASRSGSSSYSSPTPPTLAAGSSTRAPDSLT